MEKIIKILLNETATLKTQFVEMTKEYANNYFSLIEPRAKWREVDWCKFLGLTPRVVNPGMSTEFFGFPRGFYNTRASVTFDRLFSEAKTAMRIGRAEWINRAEADAVRHYESSIKKLAKRIEEKGLNIETLKATTSHIGVNIDTTLTDGEKTVRAFTIIASGPVQRPHYRYLIK